MLDGWMDGWEARLLTLQTRWVTKLAKFSKDTETFSKQDLDRLCCLADRHTQDLQSNEIGREGFICQSLCENGAMTDQECVRRGLEEE